MSLLDELREKRNTARAAADEILVRAQSEERDLTADESRDHAAAVVQVRELDDEVETRLEAELAELRAAGARAPARTEAAQPVLTRDQSVEQWCQTRGMVETTEQPLSFDRYLRGMCTGQWDGAPEERALSEGTLTAGGHLVPTPLSARVIDLARNATRVFQAGAVTVPMGAQTLKLARLTGEGTPAWHAENAAISAADMTFDAVTFTARTLTRLVTLSVELFERGTFPKEKPCGEGLMPAGVAVLRRQGLEAAAGGAPFYGVRYYAGALVAERGQSAAAAIRRDRRSPDASAAADGVPWNVSAPHGSRVDLHRPRARPLLRHAHDSQGPVDRRRHGGADDPARRPLARPRLRHRDLVQPSGGERHPELARAAQSRALRLPGLCRARAAARDAGEDTRDLAGAHGLGALPANHRDARGVDDQHLTPPRDGRRSDHRRAPPSRGSWIKTTIRFLLRAASRQLDRPHQAARPAPPRRNHPAEYPQG